MNNVEKQILANQSIIMTSLVELLNDTDNIDSIKLMMERTRDLINPKAKDESACDMSNLDEMDKEEDALLFAIGGKTE